MWILGLRGLKSISTSYIGYTQSNTNNISGSCTIQLKFPSVLNNRLPYNNTQIIINNNISGGVREFLGGSEKEKLRSVILR